MYDRKWIRELLAAGLTAAEVARVVGCSRSSVYRAVRPDARLHYRRASRWDREGARVQALLDEYPMMTATALASRSGWGGSLRQLQREVHVRRFAAMQRAGLAGPDLREKGDQPVQLAAGLVPAVLRPL